MRYYLKHFSLYLPQRYLPFLREVIKEILEVLKEDERRDLTSSSVSSSVSVFGSLLTTGTPAAADEPTTAAQQQQQQQQLLSHSKLNCCLCYLSHTLLKYLSRDLLTEGRSKDTEIIAIAIAHPIDMNFVRTSLELILTLPQSFLQDSLLKTICGCILSSSKLMKVLALTEILERIQIYNWFDCTQEQEDGSKDDLKILTHCPALEDFIASTSIHEFAWHPFEYWKDCLAQDIKIFVDEQQSAGEDHASVISVSKEELITALENIWKRSHDLLCLCKARTT
jgi:hypothetical protein